MDKSDYILKMDKILDDNKKFQRIGPCNANDNTAKIESKLQRRLPQLYNNDELPESVYKAIRPLARKDRGSMDYQKLTNRTFLFDLFYP